MFLNGINKRIAYYLEYFLENSRSVDNMKDVVDSMISFVTVGLKLAIKITPETTECGGEDKNPSTFFFFFLFFKSG